MKENIAIIGGGVTGLVAAYRLSKRGHKVTVLEKSNELGGLLSGFKINGTSLEKAYHHIFKTDKEIINLAKELNISKKLKWHESSIGLYYKNKIYPFVTPMELLSFGGLGLIDKFRLGLVYIYLQKTNNWEKFVSVRASEWMEKYCGKKAYEVIWLPLLKGKFHEYYKEVSMAWLWARIHIRANSKDKGDAKEMLGYFDGGFEIIIKRLEEKIKKNGGIIRLNYDISKIDKLKNDKIKIIGNKTEEYDKVIACVPNNVLARLIDGKKYSNYINQLQSIDYLGAIILIFSSEQSLSKYYWHNINDINSPFLAFIQHTNLVDKSDYKNENVYYLGTYLPHEHRYFSDDDQKISQEFFDYLKKIFPEFDKKQVNQKYIFKLKNAQHVVDTKYLSKIPKFETPIKNLYLANFSQIFPEDRGINYAVLEAEKIVRLLSQR